MKKPIAVVHWMDGEREKSKECFDQDTLNRFMLMMRNGNYMSFTCICEGSAKIPFKPPRSTFR